MLLIQRLLRRHSMLVRVRKGDESGAILVAVVIVMLLGFLVATTVAVFVTFTIRSNAKNHGFTQAFVAAESGRDTAIQQIVNAIGADGKIDCSKVVLTDSGASPDYTYDINVTSSAVRPTKAIDAGVSSGCPTSATTFVVIHAIGTAPNGGRSEIDAVYPWKITHVEQPAGTMAYFDGQFKATKTTYTGDLVIRSDNALYTCNNLSTIDGDLWVVRGSVVLSTGCTITGSIYAKGYVSSSSQNITIGKDIMAGGDVNMSSDGVKVGGGITSGGVVTLSDTGSTPATVGGAVTGKTMPVIGNKWRKLSDNSQLAGAIGAAPVFSPALEDVRAVTQWLEIASSGVWGTPTTTPTTTKYTTCDSAIIRTELAHPGVGRALFDMSACLSPNGKIINIDLTGTPYTLARDAVFFVPSSKGMNLNVTAQINKSGDPQLVFAHADGNSGDASPTACGQGQDSVAIGGAVAPRMMIYSPCGLNGNISTSFTGQLYTANSGNHLVLSAFTCAPMGWLPAFGQLSCGITGDGGALETSKDVVSLDDRVMQTESPG